MNMELVEYLLIPITSRIFNVFLKIVLMFQK